jgi:hypothetical protein
MVCLGRRGEHRHALREQAFDGTVFHFLRNSASMRAITSTDPNAPIPFQAQRVRRQLNGPVIRNKTFFFFS